MGYFQDMFDKERLNTDSQSDLSLLKTESKSNMLFEKLDILFVYSFYTVLLREV